MNTGQTFLTIGSLILLTFLIMNMLRNMGRYEDVYTETRTELEAMALTTSLIEEASQLPFDEVSWDSTNLNKSLADFTLAANLGPDAGETDFTLYDDFDDYNGYSRLDTSVQSAYRISCRVNYVTAALPDVVSPIRTYYKRITVTAVNTLISDSLQLYYIHGYWYFN